MFENMSEIILKAPKFEPIVLDSQEEEVNIELKEKPKKKRRPSVKRTTTKKTKKKSLSKKTTG